MISAGIVLDPPLNGSGMNISLICVQMQNIESTKQLCLILSVENWAKTKIFLYTRWSSTDCLLKTLLAELAVFKHSVAAALQVISIY